MQEYRSRNKTILIKLGKNRKVIVKNRNLVKVLKFENFLKIKNFKSG